MNKEQLIELINYHNNKYWNENNPQISDIDYDILMYQLKQLDPTNILLIKKLCYNIDKRRKVKHHIKLYSLDKIYIYNDLIKWMDKVSRNKNEKFELQLKFDGWSGYLLNGRFYTGGDGEYGEDITFKSRYIEILKLKCNDDKLEEFKINLDKLNSKNISFIGEYIIKKSDFKQNEHLLVRKTGEPYKTERSALSGLVGSDSVNSKINNLIKLVLYENSGITCTLTQFEQLDFKKITDFLKYIYNDYPSDGIVIKLYDREYAKSLGYNNLFPKGDISFKFLNPSNITKLINIQWLMGKNNTINPLAIVSPVIIEGKTIKKINLHNIDYIEKLNLYIDDIVEVELSGMIIPNITKKISNGDNRSSIEYPNKCPICNFSTYLNKPFLYCSNDLCEGSLSKILEDSCKRLDINNLAESTINKLINTETIENIVDVLKLNKQDFLLLDGFAEKSAEKLENEINRVVKLEYPDWKLLSILNINGIGDSLSKEVLKVYSLKQLLNFIENDNLLSLNDLNIDNFAYERKRALIEGLTKNYYILKELMEILKYYETKNLINNNPTICFSGKMPLSRDKYEQIAINNNYVPVKSVNKDLSLLVTEEQSSSKTLKAKKLGLKIISLQEFLNIVKIDL